MTDSIFQELGEMEEGDTISGVPWTAYGETFHVTFRADDVRNGWMSTRIEGRHTVSMDGGPELTEEFAVYASPEGVHENLFPTIDRLMDEAGKEKTNPDPVREFLAKKVRPYLSVSTPWSN